jgi:hypothetical protein
MCHRQCLARRRSALAIVRAEESRRIGRGREKGELPPKVYGVLDSRVHPLPGGWREGVGGVSRKIEAATAQSRGESVLQAVARRPHKFGDLRIQASVVQQRLQLGERDGGTRLPERQRVSTSRAGR